MKAYAGLWEQTQKRLAWRCPFVLPFWLETIWHHLGIEGEPKIFVILDEKSNIAGIAPMVIREGEAAFLGPHHVCDYQDMIMAEGREVDVLSDLLGHLGEMGIKTVTFRTLHPDARLKPALDSLADQKAITLQSDADEMTYEMDLPQDWDGYLMQLNGKQRHEVRRKIRRLESNGTFDFRLADNHNKSQLFENTDIFFKLFRSNRSDKAEFMTDAMENYFKALIVELAARDLLRLGFLDVNGYPSASVLCFDYLGVRYLYNSGYDQQYDELSVGILSKVFSIQEAIGRGCKRFDFLKGEEIYKGRIGGNRVPLLQYQVRL